jgi:hypothetical protein
MIMADVEVLFYGIKPNRWEKKLCANVLNFAKLALVDPGNHLNLWMLHHMAWTHPVVVLHCM